MSGENSLYGLIPQGTAIMAGIADKQFSSLPFDDKSHGQRCQQGCDSFSYISASLTGEYIKVEVAEEGQEKPMAL